MFQNIRKYFKKSRTFGVILQSYNGVTQWVSGKLKTYANEGYNKNVYVYSAVERVSNSVGSVSWSVYKEPQSSKDDRVKIYNHPAERLLNKPNPFENGVSFRTKILQNLLIFGNCYIEKIQPRGKNQINELYLLRPDRVSITPAENKTNGLVKNYIYDADGFKRTIPADKIIHLKRYNPLDDLKGLSPIQVAGMAIDQNNLTKTWNIDILGNGGMPSGTLKSPFNLTEEEYHKLKTQLSSFSADKRGQAMILESGLEFERLSMSSEEMGYIQASKMSAREISIVFGVPPEILGDSTNKTYNNYTQARKAFYEETVIVWLDWLSEELGRRIIEGFGLDGEEYSFSYNKEDIEAIQEDINIKWEKANNSYFLSFNEKRNLVGYEDVKGGEVFAIPNTLTIIKSMEDVVKAQEDIEKIRDKLSQNEPQKNEDSDEEVSDEVSDSES